MKNSKRYNVWADDDCKQKEKDFFSREKWQIGDSIVMHMNVPRHL